jgi:hypothetical protein
LNADLLSHDSATLTLERWCDSHRLSSPAKIVAEQVYGVDKMPTAEQRQELRVNASERVQLPSGAAALRRLHLIRGRQLVCIVETHAQYEPRG